MESSRNDGQGDVKAVVMLRVAPALKARLLAYARERRLTLNAAAIVLLDQALEKGDSSGRQM
jgi:hypothetical protein